MLLLYLGWVPNTARLLASSVTPGLEDLTHSFGCCWLSTCVVQRHTQAEHHTHENKVNKGVRAPPTKQTSHHLQLTGAQECHSYPATDFLSSRFLGKKHLRFLQKPKKSSRASEAQVCVLVRAHRCACSTPICPSAGKTTQIAVGGGSCFPAPSGSSSGSTQKPGAASDGSVCCLPVFLTVFIPVEHCKLKH